MVFKIFLLINGMKYRSNCTNALHSELDTIRMYAHVLVHFVMQYLFIFILIMLKLVLNM